MPRANSWSDLKIGLLAFGGIVAVAAAVLLFARVGALRGAKMRLYLVTSEARQVTQGSEVWLGGEQVGLVNAIRFQPVSVDTAERIVIEMDVLAQHAGQIRRNSDVRIRPGANLIGEPVVDITVGTTAAPPVTDGDTLRALAQVEKHHPAADIASIGDSVVAVAGTVRELASEIRITNGKMAQLRQRSEAQIAAVGKAIDRYGMRATQSHGTVSRTLHDSAMRRQVASLSAQKDSLRTLLTSRHNSLGRFRRDSTLLRSARQLVAAVDTLRGQLTDRGMMARADSALPRQLDQMHTQLDSLIDHVKNHLLKYLPL